MSAALRAAVVVIMLAVGAVPFADAGRAQGFFQSLFGFGNPAPAPARPALPPSYRAPIVPPVRSAPGDDGDHEPAISLSGNYRTMCVRMCDGYYFPISASVSRRAFHRDAGICRASCGNEAQLFFHPSSSGDAATMVDLTGRAYAKLPNAFRYRKTLVDGCKCKPEPWAQSEVDRHLAYAARATAAARSMASDSINPHPRASTEADSLTKVAETSAAQPVSPALNPGPIASELTPKRATRREKSAAQRPATNRPDRRPSIDPSKAPARPVVAAAKPQGPVKSSPYGLGGGGLRWPGD